MWRKIITFLFDSVYQVVTWVWIGVSISAFFFFASNKSKNGMIGSAVSLLAAILLMLALMAKKHFWDGEADKPHTRPELYSHAAWMLPLEAGQPETVLVGIGNRGDATARNICLGGGNHVFTTPEFTGPLVYKHVPVQVRPDIGPHDKEENSMVSASDQPLSQQQIDLLKEGKELFFHFAEGEYSDDAGNTYPIDYCYMFNPKSPKVMRVCPEKFWPKSRTDRRGIPSLDAIAAPVVPKAEKPTPPVKPPRMVGTPPSNIGHPRPYDNIKWTDYTEDWFYDVIWRWHYKPPSKTPRDIRPFCPECSYPSEMDYRLIFPRDSPIFTRDVVHLRLKCRDHPQVYRAEHIPNMQLDDFSKIKTLIEGKLADDSWRQAVIDQKKARDGKYD